VHQVSGSFAFKIEKIPPLLAEHLPQTESSNQLEAQHAGPGSTHASPSDASPRIFHQAGLVSDLSAPTSRFHLPKSSSSGATVRRQRSSAQSLGMAVWWAWDWNAAAAANNPCRETHGRLDVTLWPLCVLPGSLSSTVRVGTCSQRESSARGAGTFSITGRYPHCQRPNPTDCCCDFCTVYLRFSSHIRPQRCHTFVPLDCGLSNFTSSNRMHLLGLLPQTVVSNGTSTKPVDRYHPNYHTMACARPLTSV
jgi:hypothetical protein